MSLVPTAVTTWGFARRVLGRFCGTDGWFRDKGPDLPSIPFGCDAEFGPERAVEVRDISEPRVERDVDDFRPVLRQPSGGLSEAGPQDELVRGHTGELLERPQIVEWAQTCVGGQLMERPASGGGAFDRPHAPRHPGKRARRRLGTATQRSPAACSCPHSKHWPAFPSRNEPGVIRSRPSGVRY